MTLGQLLSILRARWMVALTVFISVLAVALAVTLMLPSQYTAVATVVVDTRPDPVVGAAFPGLGSPTYVKTQADVLKSRRVILLAIQSLRLAEVPAVLEQFQAATGGAGSIESWLADSIILNVEATPSVDSNVISLSFRASDPRFAASVANAIVRAFLETTSGLRVDPAKQYSTFFESRSKDAREALERAQQRLSAFQRKNGIVATDERYDVENARLAELSTQLVAVQALAAESGSRQAQVQVGAGDRMQEVLANSLVAGLKADLSRQEAKLREIGSRYGDQHPQVQELKASIAELNSRIDTETRRVTGGVGVSNAIVRSREAQIRAALDEQRARVLQMKAVRDEGLVMVREVENAQRAYELTMQRFNQTLLESQSNVASNVHALSAAEVPFKASSPNIPLNMAIATFLGGLLALGAALALELIDRRVRSLEDITGLLELPILGVVPEMGSAPRLGAGRALGMRDRILASLPAPTKG